LRQVPGGRRAHPLSNSLLRPMAWILAAVDSMAVQLGASTVVRATVEASTVVVAALVEAATEVAAEATVAESTRSI